MMARRRIPSETFSPSQNPTASGPRWRRHSVIDSRTLRLCGPVNPTMPNIEENRCCYLTTGAAHLAACYQVLRPAQENVMTTLVVLQPGYLPWLGYFDLLKKADVFVHYDDVEFDKHGWRNRNRVKGPKGAIWLTVPVLHGGRGAQSILEVEIDNRQSWRRKQLSTLEQLYARAPFSEAYLPRLREILERPWSRLVDLDFAVIEWLAETVRYAA